MTEYAKKDIQIRELQCEIDHRKMLLAKKLGYLHKTSKTNSFLESVVTDYKNYNKYIVDEKRKQEEAMTNILDHLNSIVSKDNLTKESLEHAKLQQHDILNELETLKKSLSEIVDSNNIS